MVQTILLNKQVYHLTEDNLPCLITYQEKSGGSHFSVTLIANLFLAGSKVLFLTAYPMAKDNFLQQVKDMESKIAYVKSESEIKQNKDAQAIILESRNSDLFVKAVKCLNDINERVVFIKNMEVFSNSVINPALNFKKLILSGDIDKCTSKKQISKKKFRTTVIFSKPKILLPIAPPKLEKYTGYLWTDNKESFVSVQI